ncbi:DUF2628 domain-containing protein [Lentibacillus sp. N15]|uniref:DUF2628 domain-containing protein n=1 Tax=Lentibacillus songyuanensis TaxID=3136161 RepID=UPI0031BBC2C1
MYCTNCGAEIDNDANFCANCGHVKVEPVSATQMTTEPTSGGPDNENVSKVDKDEQDFVGNNYDFYFKKWGQMRTKNNTFSRNWAAFFLGIFWLGYRKMYREVFFIALIFLGIDFVLYLVGYQYSADEFYDPIDRGINLGLMVVLGFYGNYFYQKHVRKKVSLIQSKGLPDEVKQMELKRQGGASFLGCLWAVGILAIVYVIPTAFIPMNFDAVGAIQNSAFDEHPDETVEELFMDVFDDGSWKEVTNDSDTSVVRYTGEKQIDNSQHDIEIEFVTANDEDIFTVERIFVDDEELTAAEMNSFLDYVFHGGLQGGDSFEQDDPGYMW